jgi:2,3-bisphosphoglycerate-dependent phosphoglycerate mutase
VSSGVLTAAGRPAPNARLVLVRHGQSLWNLENRFTGWTDVPLTDAGREEARSCARLLRGWRFDVAYTSALSRAQETLELILTGLEQAPPVIRDPALNERHYGDLQGLDKAQVAEQFGAHQVQLWRRSYAVAPPGGESLEMTARRTLPFFERAVRGDLTRGKSVLLVAHGKSLRAILMKLDALGSQQVVDLEIGTGVPIAYELTPEGAIRDKKILR